MVSCNNFQEHGEIKKLKEGIAKELWQYDGHIPEAWEAYPLSHKRFWHDRADSLLRNLPIPLYIDTGELTLGEVAEAKYPSVGLKSPRQHVNQQDLNIAKAARDKFVSIGNLMEEK